MVLALMTLLVRLECRAREDRRVRRRVQSQSGFDAESQDLAGERRSTPPTDDSPQTSEHDSERASAAPRR